MSYIGNTPTQQNFVAGADQFNGDGSSTAFTLSRNVNTVFDIFVAISNVPQDPYSAYSVSGNTLTFTSAPPSGTGNIYVVYRATNVQTFVPTQGVSPSFGNLTYTGTLTGSTGVMNIGSGQVYKATSGNVGIGTSSPGAKLDVRGSSIFLVNATNPTAWVSVDSALTTGSMYNQWNTSSNVGISGTYTNHAYTFVTNNTERMRIDTSGNVGIGAASPTSTTKFYVEQSAGNVLGYFNSTAASQNARVRINSTDTASSVAYVWSYSNASLNKQASIYLTGTGALATQVGQTAGAEPTTGTTAMFIDTSGNLLVGRTSNLGTSRFVVEADTTSTNPMTVSNSRSTAATDYSVLFYRNATLVGSIQTTLSATSYVTSSDYRLKENVQPMTGALAKVAALKPCTYTWKSDGSAGEGFIAHELAEVVPDAVTGDKDAVNEDGSIKPQGIDTSFLVATLTAAIQELNAKVEAQAAEIAALKGAA